MTVGVRQDFLAILSQAPGDGVGCAVTHDSKAAGVGNRSVGEEEGAGEADGDAVEAALGGFLDGAFGAGLGAGLGANAGGGLGTSTGAAAAAAEDLVLLVLIVRAALMVMGRRCEQCVKRRAVNGMVLAFTMSPPALPIIEGYMRFLHLHNIAFRQLSRQNAQN